MKLLERLITTIAPHNCLVCSNEGALLCSGCTNGLSTPPSRCYRCRAITVDSRTCSSCRSASSLRSVWVGTEYLGLAQALVRLLKFEHIRSSAEVMSRHLNSVYDLPDGVILVPVPTATSRKRARGFDQAQLLAKNLAGDMKLERVSVLARLGQSRQVGTKRTARLKQLEHAFRIRYPALIQGEHVVLVDDVLTTGATLESAARTLRDAGARHVDALVFTQA